MKNHENIDIHNRCRFLGDLLFYDIAGTGDV